MLLARLNHFLRFAEQRLSNLLMAIQDERDGKEQLEDVLIYTYIYIYVCSAG